jgi:hypothetical protein
VQKRARGARATPLPRPGDRMRKWTPSLHTVMQHQADDAHFGGNTDAGGHQRTPPSVECSQPLAAGVVNVHIPSPGAFQLCAQVFDLVYHLEGSTAPAKVL